MPRLAAVLLAAGESRRMGGPNKLLIEVDGEPLVRRTARTLLAAGLAPVLVVLGHAPERVRPLLQGLALQMVENPAWRDGQQGSVQAGLAALAPVLAEGAHAGVAVVLSDLPLLQPAHLRELAQAFARRGAARCLVPRHRGERGNPVLFEAGLVPELLAEPGGPRDWIAAHPEAVTRHDAAHAGFTTDLDTLADVAALQALPGGPRIRLP
jgi:molybdenum cofactor cytidylyltransferase